MRKVHGKNGNQISSFEILSCCKTIYAFNLVWSLREKQVRMWSPQKRTRSKDNVWASPCLVIPYYKSWEELGMWGTTKNMPVVHVLVDCCFARKVWGFSSLPSVLNWPTFHNFEDFVLHNDIELLFTVAWWIWIAWNIRIWENQLTPARDICTHASSLVSEFLNQIQKLPA